LLPTPYSTLVALVNLMKEESFYKVILYTLLRVVLGVFLGVIFGIILAFVSYKIAFIRKLFSPLISIIKATPVVTFITLLWISMSGNELTVFIAFLMVLPIIWQNILNGLDAIPNELSEVCLVFEFSKRKRLKLLTLPVLMNYFFPALITSIGLAWKAEIATEIITYTKNSIGQNISDARYFLFTDEVFAWVAVIIVFSLSLELITKNILRRTKR
jgi:NitT/TauT family transport system permease protein